MKWFFRITGLIFALFALAIIAGAFLPETEIVERSRLINTDATTVYDRIADLETWPDWSHHVPATPSVAFGETYGVGANMAWQTQSSVGSVDILQATDNSLVLANVQSDAQSWVLTYALAPQEGETMVLLKQERDLGGFPFLDRLAAKLQQSSIESDIDASLAALADQLVD